MIKLALPLGLGCALLVLAGCETCTPSRGGVVSEPANQLARPGDQVVFSALIRAPAGSNTKSERHRWFYNGSLIDDGLAAEYGLSGQNTPRLQVDSAQLKNVGFYRYALEGEDSYGHSYARHSHVAELLFLSGFREKAGDAGVGYGPSGGPLAAAAPQQRDGGFLLVATNSSFPLVVYGTPIAGGDGAGTTCPGPYVGYVDYTNPNSPSGGWTVINNGLPAKAYDAVNPANTVVRYYGVPYSNSQCSTNVPFSVYPYRFRIYFKSTIPRGPYPITLVNFNVPPIGPVARGPDQKLNTAWATSVRCRGSSL